ncbi:MAG TPA: hypothetical protein VFK80_10470 [Limnochordia bacterium]|nr:hypothetical protein [Limnochordia bacterium]
MSGSKRLRVALLGLDGFFFSGELLRRLQAMPDVEVVAVSTLGAAADEIAANHGPSAVSMAAVGLRVYGDLSELLAEQVVDAACLSTRPSRIKHVLPELAARGIPCYVAKPAAAAMGGLAALASAVNAGLPLVSGLTGRLEPALAAARARLAGGEAGRLASLRVMHQHGRLSGWPHGSWYFAAAETAPEIFLGWYCLDLIAWLGQSRIVRIWGRGNRLADPESPHADTIKGVCELENGVIASFDVYFGVNWPYPSFELEALGAEGAVRVTQTQSDGQLYGAAGTRAFGRTNADLLSAELDNWVSAQLGRGAPFISGAEVVQNLKACLALRAALASGEGVTVG